MKRLVVVVPLLLLLVAAAPAQGSSKQGAATGAKAAKVTTSIEILPDRGVFGIISSSKPRKCAIGRQVTLFKKTQGSSTRIGEVRAKKGKTGVIWSLTGKQARSGTVFAKLAPVAGCETDSARKAIVPRSGDYPVCPSLGDICHLTLMKISDTVAPFDERYCQSWMESRGYDHTSDCSSEITKGPEPFCCWDSAFTSWQRKTRGEGPRTFQIKGVKYDSSGFNPTTTTSLSGSIPAGNSPRFLVTKATANVWHLGPDVEWYTPDLGDQYNPAAVGGPLYINFEQGSFRAFDIYIGGYLYKR